MYLWKYMKKFLLYIIPDSDPCRRAQEYLRERSVNFTTVDASKPANAKKLIEETKQLSVPVLVTDHDAVVGFAPSAYDKLIE